MGEADGFGKGVEYRVTAICGENKWDTRLRVKLTAPNVFSQLMKIFFFSRPPKDPPLPLDCWEVKKLFKELALFVANCL